MIIINKSTIYRQSYTQLRGLIDLIQELPNNLTWCEIGCCEGESTELWALRCQRLYCMDSWNWDIKTFVSPEEAEGIFDLRMAKFRNIFIKLKGRSDNVNLLNMIPDRSLDGGYIDGFHSYEVCKQDIINIARKTKDKGYITGHDFFNPSTPGVTRAVKELFGEPDMTFQDWSWLCFFNRGKMKGVLNDL